MSLGRGKAECDGAVGMDFGGDKGRRLGLALGESAGAEKEENKAGFGHETIVYPSRPGRRKRQPTSSKVYPATC